MVARDGLLQRYAMFGVQVRDRQRQLKRMRYEVVASNHTRTRMAIPPSLPVVFTSMHTAQTVASIYGSFCLGMTYAQVERHLEDRLQSGME